MIEILTDNHYDKIMDVFEATQKKIKIVSPFLSMNMAKKLCDIVNNHNVECTFISLQFVSILYQPNI